MPRRHSMFPRKTIKRRFQRHLRVAATANEKERARARARFCSWSSSFIGGSSNRLKKKRTSSRSPPDRPSLRHGSEAYFSAEAPVNSKKALSRSHGAGEKGSERCLGVPLLESEEGSGAEKKRKKEKNCEGVERKKERPEPATGKKIAQACFFLFFFVSFLFSSLPPLPLPLSPPSCY